VQCWLSRDRSRRETAEELHVHPNTLDKRLERVRVLTGIEIGTTRGVAVLQAGLVALQIDDTLR
jgi:sugar diacid utilization regulator